jgi:hypothetical protein
VTGYHHVRPYTRRDGTRVRGHKRRNPSRADTGAAILAVVLILVFLHATASRQSATHPAKPSSHSQQTAPDQHPHAAQRSKILGRSGY